jgi:hypothetical protein
MSDSAYYRPLGGGRFEASEHTVSPWGPELQHLGPPSALLTRALERFEPTAERALRRINIDALGPVPVGIVEVRAERVRAGRAIELLAAEMRAEGRTVARAWGWRMAVTDTRAGEGGAAPTLPPPEAGSPLAIPGNWQPGFAETLETRWLSGSFAEPGPGRVWARMARPLVDDDPFTPLQRVMATADCGNGVAARLDVGSWRYLNVDLSVHLHRAPVGEWFALDATTTIGPDGGGVSSAVLHDERGPVGISAQSLLIQRRLDDA